MWMFSEAVQCRCLVEMYNVCLVELYSVDV